MLSNNVQTNSNIKNSSKKFGPGDMTRWEDLSSHEKTALRKLAKGEVHEVSARMIRRLAALGLADGSPEGRLTPAGLEIYRARPIGRWK